MTTIQSTLPKIVEQQEKQQQFRNTIEVLCFNKKIVPAIPGHFSLARRDVLVLNDQLQPVLVDIPGPRARLKLTSSRPLKVDSETGQVMVMTHANERKPEWLAIYPVWSEDKKEVKAVKDTRGGFVRMVE